LLKDQAAAGRLFAGIAEAPALALQAFGVLRQRRMTCLPSASHQLSGCNFVDQPVVVDGNCITAQGSGAALPFALALVEQLCGKAARATVAKELMV
jgi:4-methyl-5(b-hydroxyethyl)-thiazole monophosphate biosynthesis